jgi:hypothetical protein
MPYEPREGDLSIFKNDNATGKQPQYRGSALINGGKYKLSLWVKESKKGKFFSGKIEPDNYVPGLNRGVAEIDRSTADEIPPDNTNDLPF